MLKNIKPASGILILSNLKNIKPAVTLIKKYVNNLYIHLNVPKGVKVQVPQWSSVISKIYMDFLYHDSNMDVKVLINSIKNKPINTNLSNIQHIFCDGKFPDICASLKQIYNIDNPEVFINNETTTPFFDFDDNNNLSSSNYKMHDVVVLGGTFDKIHLGHKIFLTEAVLRACKKLVVGVTNEHMLKSKVLTYLISPPQKRVNDVNKFLNEIDSTLHYEVVVIDDPFGPTKSDPNMDMIIVSAETYRGGLKVNEIRKQNNLKELEIYTINIIESEHDIKNKHKEKKFSSSNYRMDLLGTLLKTPEPRPHIPKQPYIIGLTGNIGSGKSKMAERLSEMGAYIIDCDKVAHEIYEPDQPAYQKIVDYFGKDIVMSDRKIDRKKLGSIVFNNPEKLEKLNVLVWPVIMQEVKRRISCLESVEIVVIEAAILFKAGWEKECHEVWSMIVPEEISVKRVQERNNLSEEEARKRIANQLKSKDIIEKSNIIFSSEWSYEFSQYQAEKAWLELKKRLNILRK